MDDTDVLPHPATAPAPVGAPKVPAGAAAAHEATRALAAAASQPQSAAALATGMLRDEQARVHELQLELNRVRGVVDALVKNVHYAHQCPVCLECPRAMWVNTCGHGLCATCLATEYCVEDTLFKVQPNEINAGGGGCAVLVRSLRDAEARGRNAPRCPTCRDPLEFEHMTRVLRSIVDDEHVARSLLTQCEYCKESMPEADVTVHQAWVCAGQTPCSLCKAKVPRACMANHLNYTCPRKHLACEQCDTIVPRSEYADHITMHSHTTCECGERIERSALPHHRQHVCPETLCTCHACLRPVARKLLREHHVREHMREGAQAPVSAFEVIVQAARRTPHAGAPENPGAGVSDEYDDAVSELDSETGAEVPTLPMPASTRAILDTSRVTTAEAHRLLRRYGVRRPPIIVATAP